MFDPKPGRPPPCETRKRYEQSEAEVRPYAYARVEAVIGADCDACFAVKLDRRCPCCISRTELRFTGPLSSSSRGGHAESMNAMYRPRSRPEVSSPPIAPKEPSASGISSSHDAPLHRYPRARPPEGTPS